MIDIEEAIRCRHSVRSYTDKKIEGEARRQLDECISQCNADCPTLHLQLVVDEPDAFGKSIMARYGKFRNVRNYVCLVARKSDESDILLGYYGEKVVLLAQQLGLNTCWVGLSYSKGNVHCEILPGERLEAVIAIGYGDTQGIQHKSRTPEQICSSIANTPAWFQRGVEFALLAPTAVNQQKFRFDYLPDGNVHAYTGWGFYSKMDLGIAKLHFEIGAGKATFEWR